MSLKSISDSCSLCSKGLPHSSLLKGNLILVRKDRHVPGLEDDAEAGVKSISPAYETIFTLLLSIMAVAQVGSR